MGIVQVGVILGRNCPAGSYPGWEFSLVGVFRVGIVRGNLPGGSFPSTIFHLTLFRMGLFVAAHGW